MVPAGERARRHSPSDAPRWVFKDICRELGSPSPSSGCSCRSVQPSWAPHPRQSLAPPASILTAREAKTSHCPAASAVTYESFECAQYYFIVHNLVALCSHSCLSTTSEPSCSTAKLLVISFVWLLTRVYDLRLYLYLSTVPMLLLIKGKLLINNYT